MDREVENSYTIYVYVGGGMAGLVPVRLSLCPAGVTTCLAISAILVMQLTDTMSLDITVLRFFYLLLVDRFDKFIVFIEVNKPF